MSWELVYTILGSIATGGGILAAIWKGRKPAARFGGKCKALINLPADVAASRAEIASSRRELESVSALVNKELRPNGGGSIRDVVTRLDRQYVIADATNLAMMAHLGMAVWRSDASGNCTYASRELLRLTDSIADEYVGRAWVSLIHAAQRDAVVREWESCVRDARDFAMDYSFVTACGNEIPVRAEASIVRDPKGNPIGFVGRIERRGAPQ